MKRKRWDEVLDRLPSHRRVMVEIGVWQGALAKRLLEQRGALMLTMVDPWVAGESNLSWYQTGSKMAQRSQAHMEENYQHVRAMAQLYVGRAQIIRLPSIEAAAQIVNGSQDLVFIDADHSYEAVRSDLTAWAPKVRSGGYLGGHDFDAPRFPGVRQAVEEAFAADTIERGADHCWFRRMP